MSIVNLQVKSALTHVIHPNFGKDLITLEMIRDIVVQEKFITFTIEMADENPSLAAKLKDLCENAIYRYVDKEAILDIQTELNTFKQAKIEKNETSEIENSNNPMNMDEITAENFVSPTTIEPVSYEDMPLLLREFMDDHREYLIELEKFEKALIHFKERQWQFDEELSQTFGKFFTYLDNHVLEHNQREEETVFPLLKKRLMETGEHSQFSKYIETDEIRTAVDVMKDEHTKLLQLSALTFNFLGLSQKLPDIASQSIVSDLAFEQGRQIVELLRLHIRREDETLFTLAYQLIDQKEFEEMQA